MAIDLYIIMRWNNGCWHPQNWNGRTLAFLTNEEAVGWIQDHNDFGEPLYAVASTNDPDTLQIFIDGVEQTPDTLLASIQQLYGFASSLLKGAAQHEFDIKLYDMLNTEPSQKNVLREIRSLLDALNGEGTSYARFTMFADGSGRIESEPDEEHPKNTFNGMYRHASFHDVAAIRTALQESIAAQRS
jgi:hypothetical protein